MGCSDALTYLGEPAVLSVGTLFQAALLPGILLAFLYAAYAFGFALLNPSKAPAVELGAANSEPITRNEGLTWFLAVPGGLIIALVFLMNLGVIGSQSTIVDSFTDSGDSASLRTNVSEQCAVAMEELHGTEAWNNALAEQAAIDAAGGVQSGRALSDEERAELVIQAAADAPVIGTGIAILALMILITLSFARGVAMSANTLPLLVSAAGVGLMLLADIVLIGALTSAGVTTVIIALPLLLVLWGMRDAIARLAKNDLLRVVFPPLVLIVAVLGSILGGVTNPTPAAALGAGGAIMLAAYRKLKDQEKSGKIILLSAASVALMLVVGINFDMRMGQPDIQFEDKLGFAFAMTMFLFSMFGLLYACAVLWLGGVLTPVVRETAKVTSMVFTILIGSQLLNLVVISFGGEHYIQQFLRSFDEEWTVFLIVMLVLFVLGFVLDFLEIIYIVIPIVGPVIYGGSFDPKWVTIMIAVNLQTSFLTPPFGFALFYLRGVAPAGVTTGHIYRGVIPFVLIQVFGLIILALFPAIVTLVPNLLN